MENTCSKMNIMGVYKYDVMIPLQRINWKCIWLVLSYDSANTNGMYTLML
jgi:hypothetical protein